MKANELRIGNYYDFSNSGQIEQITGKDIYEFESDPIDDIYYPIPLTEEWLVKFWFEKKTKSFVNRMSIKVQNKYFFYTPTSIMINSVHQLQNLYFALTGEELTIKK